MMVPIEQGWLKTAEPPPGAWVAWELTDGSLKGWSLKVWPVFDVQIRYERYDPGYHLSINGAPLGKWPKLDDAKAGAENEIVRRIGAMLPVYKIVHARVKVRRRV
jgi:hypothetical protein